LNKPPEIKQIVGISPKSFYNVEGCSLTGCTVWSRVGQFPEDVVIRVPNKIALILFSHIVHGPAHVTKPPQKHLRSYSLDQIMQESDGYLSIVQFLVGDLGVRNGLQSLTRPWGRKHPFLSSSHSFCSFSIEIP